MLSFIAFILAVLAFLLAPSDWSRILGIAAFWIAIAAVIFALRSESRNAGEVEAP